MQDFLVQAWPYAAAVLVILGVVALVFLIIILYRTSITMKSVQKIAADAEKDVTPALAKVNPMVDKAELMLDTVNLEMLRVDSILEDVEQITDVAGKAATTVDTVTSAPAEAVTSLIGRIRGTFDSKRSNKLKQEHLVYPIGGSLEAEASAESEASDDDGEALKKAAQKVADDASTESAPSTTEAAVPAQPSDACPVPAPPVVTEATAVTGDHSIPSSK